MAEVVLCAASAVAGCLVAPVNRLCGYVLSYDSHVRKLKAKVAELANARQEMQDSINDARNNAKPIKPRVKKWMEDVDAEEARRALDDDRGANETCFYGWLPNLKVRYRLGREARRKAERIQSLIDQKPSGDVYDNLPPGLVDGASNMISLAGDRSDTIFGSRASILKDIMNALDVEKHKVIGIYGPGGVGKTTLLEEVEKKLRKEGRPFHMIVKSKVSQTPDLKKIQDNIAYAFGLNLRDETSEEGRKDLLFKRLQMNPSEKVLIILDDLWGELDLKAIGNPLGNESMKCKLLLTSRDKRVLEQRMHADATFRLNSLEEDEAFKLFEKGVGDKLRDDEELKVKAAQVVTKLAGLPLLINSVASTLKYSDVSTWEDMLIIEDPNNERIVKWSYDHLESEDAKCLFLLCGLIGGTIRVELLLGIGMGLGLFGGFDNKMQSSRNRLNTMLNSLHSFCLLQDGGDGKENVTIHDLYSEVVVSTPLRDQNSLMMNSNYGLWSKEKLEKCWAICLADVGKDRLVELMTGQFPHLKILMLSQPEYWHWMLGPRYEVEGCSGLPDFTYMKELRVLYLHYMHITAFPSSIEILKNLRSLYLDHCDVEDVAILGNVEALQFLSFAGSKIQRLPKEIGKLTNLKLLNLSGCYKLEIIEPDVLKALTNLEELHMKGSFDKWMGKDEILLEELHMKGSFDEWMGKDEILLGSSNVRLVELERLKKLSALEISISNPTILLEVGDLPFGNLIRFWIDIGNVEGREFEGLRTMKLKLEGCNGILSKEWVQKALQKTQHLHLDGLREFKKNIHELCIQGFLQLKHLDIQNSPSVKCIASSSNGAFTILESLFLQNLIKLEKICHGDIIAECFSKLKAMIVKKCNRLKYLWRLSQMQKLVQLEEIEVRECDSMQAIVTIDSRKDIFHADYRVELPNVRRLYLANLPNMMSFCTGVGTTSEGAPIQAGVMDGGGGDKGTESIPTTSDLQNTYSDSLFDEKISLPNLEDLELNSVGSFKRIWHDELSKSSFCKLATITVENCSDLLHIFPSTIIGGLHNLQSVNVKNYPSLKSLFDFGSLDSNTEQNAVVLPELVSIDVENCPSLESLFNCGSLDSNAEHKIILLPKLKRMRVSGAKKLRHVVMSHSHIVLGFPSLETISVENCSDLGYLFPNYTATTLEKLECLEISNCEQMKEVILEKEVGRSGAEVMSFPCLSDESPQPPFSEMNTFPKIRKLKIEGVPWKKLWNNHAPADSIVCSRQSLLQSVKVENCPSLKSLFDFGSLDLNTEQKTVLLPELESIDVESCPSLESLFNYGSLDSNAEHKIILLPKLKILRVRDAEKLGHVVMSHSQIVLGFPDLVAVSVENCSDLGYLFPNYTATTLEKLEYLEIRECKRMKEVILQKEVGRSGAEVMSFPCLSDLTLQELDNFGAFIPSPRSVKRQLGKTAEENDKSPQPPFNEMITFPKIRILKIEGVSGEWLWNNHAPADSIVCSNRSLLQEVEVKNCPSLKSLFDFGSLDTNTKQKAVLLPELLSIEVRRCPSLESLFNCASFDSNGEHKIILLPKLKTVRVSRAKRLRHLAMSHSQIVLGFPSLETVRVENCSNLGYLFPNYTATTLEKLECLEISNCEHMKEVILEKEASPSKAKVMSFPCLSNLTLQGLNNLISFSLGSVKRQLGEIVEENDESPQPLFTEMVTFPNIRYLEIEGVPCKVLWNNHVPTNSIVCSHRFLLENVEVKNCPSLKLLFDFGSIDSNTEQNAILLPKLVSIDMESCPSLESLFNCRSLDSNAERKIILLPKLKTVRVSGAKKLRHVVISHSQIVLGFPSLETIRIENCSDLGYLFPNYTATTLEKLKWLTISKCEQMKEVIMEKEASPSEAKVMSFPCLSNLTLQGLDNLISFSSGSVKRQLGETVEENDESPLPLFNEMVTFPNMRDLEIEGIPCKELWNNHAPANSIVCSCRFLLEIVKVKNCPSLKSLFDFGSLDSNTEQKAVLLPQLVSIDVESCPSLESLFNCGSLHSNAEHKIIFFPKLVNVRVSGAKKLKYIVMSHSQIVLGFPSLETVGVENCSDLGYLFTNCTATTLEKLQWLTISKCEKMKEVILEKEAGPSEAKLMSFPCLSNLTLKGLDNLINFNLGSVNRQLGETTEENDESPQPLFNEMVTFPNMRDLEIEGVPCKVLWNNHVPTVSIVCSHRFLSKNVKVKNCPSLKWLFDFGSLDSNTEQNAVLLPELVSIDVENCPFLESLFNCRSLDSNAERKIILLSKLETMRVSGAKKLRHVVMSHSQIVLGFPNLVTVSVENCFDLGYLFPNYTATTLEKLKWLTISKCEQMKEVILEKEACLSEAKVMSFPCLSNLTLQGLNNLISFSSGSVKRQLGETTEENDESPQLLFNEMVTFPNMRHLEIEGVPCKVLWNNHVPTVSIVCSHRFLSKNVKVKNCPSLKWLFDFGSLDSNTEQNVVLLPELVSIDVESCPSLESLFNCRSLDSNVEHKIILLPKLEIVRVTFPNMRDLGIDGVPCKVLWSNHVPIDSIVCSHRFLSKIVEVKNCPSLKSLFDFGSIDSNTEQNAILLPELVSINVESCPSLESLFNCRSLNSNAERKIILLPKLEAVWVSGAKKLRHVVMSHSQIVLGFPSLETISIENCSDLGYLFPNYTATTLEKLKWLTISKCEHMKEVILEKEASPSEAKVMSFPCLSNLILQGLNNLISFSSGSVKRQLGETAEENDELPLSLFNEMVTFPNMRYLEIEGVPCKVLWSNHVPTNSIVCSHRFLSKIVNVKNCPSLKSLFDFGSIGSNTEENAILLPEFVRIHVESCPSLESLFNCRSFDSNAERKIILLPKLESVWVSGAKKLRHVVMSHSQIVLGFPRLESVSVENCSDLGYLFPNYTATTLEKLKWLTISKCEQMKEVIMEKEASPSEAKVMSFPCLSYLTLRGLDNLISFGSRDVKRQLGETTEENDELPQPLFNEMVTFPLITSLEIEGLRCKELWNNQIPTNSFQKLESLKLKNCDYLQHIATSYMWKKLQRCLKNLKVISCRLIKIIYEGVGINAERGRLRSLVLRDLENLRGIWQFDSLPNIPFPNLRDVVVVRCPRLEMLFPTFTAEFLEQIEKLVVESCEDMKQIAGYEKWEEGTCTTITFFELTTLRVLELPKFKSFLPEKYSLKWPCSKDCPSLQVLSIESCGAKPDQVLDN